MGKHRPAAERQDRPGRARDRLQPRRVPGKSQVGEQRRPRPAAASSAHSSPALVASRQARVARIHAEQAAPDWRRRARTAGAAALAHRRLRIKAQISGRKVAAAVHRPCPLSTEFAHVRRRMAGASTHHRRRRNPTAIYRVPRRADDHPRRDHRSARSTPLPDPLTIDLSGVERMDTVGAWLIYRAVRDRGAKVVGASREDPEPARAGRRGRPAGQGPPRTKPRPDPDARRARRVGRRDRPDALSACSASSARP